MTRPDGARLLPKGHSGPSAAERAWVRTKLAQVRPLAVLTRHLLYATLGGVAAFYNLDRFIYGAEL